MEDMLVALCGISNSSVVVVKMQWGFGVGMDPENMSVCSCVINVMND